MCSGGALCSVYFVIIDTVFMHFIASARLVVSSVTRLGYF